VAKVPAGRNRAVRGPFDLLGRLLADAAALASPAALRGTMLETAWVTAHLAIYPWGLVRERTPDAERYGYSDLTLRQRSLVVQDVEAAGTPILLVHGMVDNRAIFTVLTRRLRAHGFSQVVTLNYSPVTNDIRAAAAGLAQAVEGIAERTGYERIHIIGHSLGGLIARYYVQRLDGDAHVHTLITLGSPHSGTLTAHLVPVMLGRQLRPESDLFRELDAPAAGCRTRIVAFWSDIDQLVIPHDSAQLHHPDLDAHNEVARGVGHMSLPISGTVVKRVARLLSHTEPGALDSTGDVREAGGDPWDGDEDPTGYSLSPSA
jgi:pimeloyl-ACP methyl ester carboxylesterase